MDTGAEDERKNECEAAPSPLLKPLPLLTSQMCSSLKLSALIFFLVCVFPVLLLFVFVIFRLSPANTFSLLHRLKIPQFGPLAVAPAKKVLLLLRLLLHIAAGRWLFCRGRLEIVRRRGI